MGKFSRTNITKKSGGGNRKSSAAVPKAATKRNANGGSDDANGAGALAGAGSGAGDAVSSNGSQPSSSCNTIKAKTGSEMAAAEKISIKPHRYAGVFVMRGQNESVQLMTITPKSLMNMYHEQVVVKEDHGKQLGYRRWSPAKSNLAAALLSGMDNLYIGLGDKVLCLGAGNGCTASHIADIVGNSGVVYAVEHASWTNRKLLSLGNKRSSIVPIIENTSCPYKYRQLVKSYVDTIYCDIHCEDTEQTRKLILNARHFLKTGGHFLLVLRAASSEGSESCMSTELNADKEIAELMAEELEVLEQINLEPFAQGLVMLVGELLQEKTPPKSFGADTDTD